MDPKSILAIVLQFPLLCEAAPVRVECPKAIMPVALTMVDQPDGWRFFAETPVYLHGAALMSTPPESLGHLLEDSIAKRHKGERVYSYSLDGKFPEGKWIQCAYGERHQLTLSKRLDDHIRKYTVVVSRGEKAGQNLVRIECE